MMSFILILLIHQSNIQPSHPINIIFNVHIEPMGENHGEVDLPKYYKRRAEVLWLLDIADKYGAKLSLQSNGEYMEYCIEQGHEKDIGEYLLKGHHVGTHAHPYYRQGPHDWVRISQNSWNDYDTCKRIWKDNKTFVDSVIKLAGFNPEQINKSMTAQAPLDFALFDSLMEEFDFYIEGGGRDELMFLYFGHDVWNPWRPGKDGALSEDLSNTQFLCIPHTSQIGEAKIHGGGGVQKWIDNRVPALKKRFLMVYLEWLYHERNNLPPKVWVWGWNTHSYCNALHHDEIEDILSWLNENFIGKKSPKGNIIARYATFTDVRDEFLEWEKENPGVSSFHYKEGDPYPYHYEAMALKLWNKEQGQESFYDTKITKWEKEGINCYKLTYRPHPDSSVRPLYLIWKDSGETYIDFSSELSGDLILTDPVTGDTSITQSNNLHIAEDPIMVEPLHWCGGIAEKNLPQDLNVSLLVLKERVIISYTIPENQKIWIRVYDCTGRAIKEIFAGYKRKGSYKIFWEREIPKGVYFVLFGTEKNGVLTRKLFIF